MWTNCPQRTQKLYNIIRGSSDHNIVGLEISTKDIKINGSTVWKRCWKTFNRVRCLDNFRQTNWTDILEQTDVDIASSLLEDKICAIMDKEAPMKVIQHRTKYREWVSEDTKLEMEERDSAREVARITDSENDWAKFRQLRNSCTKKLRQDKAKNLKDIYDTIEQRKILLNCFQQQQKTTKLDFHRTTNHTINKWKNFLQTKMDGRWFGQLLF